MRRATGKADYCTLPSGNELVETQPDDSPNICLA